MLKKVKNLLKKLGPGVITGAADDDPSGITIYSQAGAQGGLSLLWTAPFTFPLMVAIQEMCARIGAVTGRGLVGTMRRHYPKSVLWLVATSVLIANTVNISADLAGMAAATRLFLPINASILAAFYALIIVLLFFSFSFKKLTSILKWLTLSLGAYVLTSFVIKQDWQLILFNTIIPHISLTRDYLLLMTAIFGTTISPYLFFWQASEEAQEIKETGKNQQQVTNSELKMIRTDVGLGMFFSNLVMFFIIAATAATLFPAGIHSIQTAEQAAAALKPLAGNAAFVLFGLGILGTGALAIPVLAGSAAYAFSELFGIEGGFSKSFAKSKIFHLIIIVSTLGGFAINVFGIDAFRALFLTGVLYGVLSPILILIILHIANSKAIMGKMTNGLFSNVLGVAILVLMSLTVLGSLVL